MITQLVLEWQVYPHIRRTLHILVEIYLGLKCVFHFSFVDLLLFHAWSTRLPLDFLRWCPICLCVITQAGSNFLQVTKPYTQTLDNRTESFFAAPPPVSISPSRRSSQLRRQRHVADITHDGRVVNVLLRVECLRFKRYGDGGIQRCGGYYSAVGNLRRHIGTLNRAHT